MVSDIKSIIEFMNTIQEVKSKLVKLETENECLKQEVIFLRGLLKDNILKEENQYIDIDKPMYK